MSKSSLRIVLVDPRGDVLFSGKSMILQPPVDDVCPPTMRSPTSESGMFAAAAYRIEQDGVGTFPENPEEIRSSRPRAA